MITTSNKKKRSGSESQFPGRLHDLMAHVEAEGLESIISWVLNGRGFIIHNPEGLLMILPLFFSQTKYRSFRRQLNMWHFQRIQEGPNKGAFIHPYFVRGNKELCSLMSRQVSFRGPTVGQAEASSETEGKTVSVTNNQGSPHNLPGFRDDVKLDDVAPLLLLRDGASPPFSLDALEPRPLPLDGRISRTNSANQHTHVRGCDDATTSIGLCFAPAGEPTGLFTSTTLTPPTNSSAVGPPRAPLLNQPIDLVPSLTFKQQHCHELHIPTSNSGRGSGVSLHHRVSAGSTNITEESCWQQEQEEDSMANDLLHDHPLEPHPVSQLNNITPLNNEWGDLTVQAFGDDWAIEKARRGGAGDTTFPSSRSI